MKILIVLLYVVFTYYTSVFSAPVGEAVLWGHKANTFFDLWTLQHIATGAIIAYLLTRLKYFKLDCLWVILLMSLFWESLELILELGHFKGLPPGVFQSGIEFWVNRSFVDPLAILFGAYLFNMNRRILPYSIGFTLIWLANALYWHLVNLS